MCSLLTNPQPYRGSLDPNLKRGNFDQNKYLRYCDVTKLMVHVIILNNQNQLKTHKINLPFILVLISKSKIGAKFVKCTSLKTFCLRFPWKSAKLLSWWTSFNSPKRTSLLRRVVSIQGLEYSTFYPARWYSINHNFYKSYPN